MPNTLKQILLAPSRREAVVADLQTLLEQEVAAKTGMSGLAIKGSYAVVNKVRAGFVPHAINQMLPEFAQRLQPTYAQYDAGRDGPLSSYFRDRESPVADVLLQVADGRARRSRHETVKRTYQKLRPQAKKHVVQALPALGALIEKYAARAQAAAPEQAQTEDQVPAPDEA